jgi:TP901 family phage tail tape measure protein
MTVENDLINVQMNIDPTQEIKKTLQDLAQFKKSMRDLEVATSGISNQFKVMRAEINKTVKALNLPSSSTPQGKIARKQFKENYGDLRTVLSTASLGSVDAAKINATATGQANILKAKLEQQFTLAYQKALGSATTSLPKVASNLKVAALAGQGIPSALPTDVNQLKQLNEASKIREAQAFLGKGTQAERTRAIQQELVLQGQIQAKLTMMKQEEKARLQLARERENAEKRIGKELEKQSNAQKDLKAKAEYSRQFTQERIFGDGGASLFKIQAGLLLNYTLMNQFFTLFQFGTQFVLQFDESLRDLQAIIAATDDEMKGLSATIIDVSEGTRFTAIEVANAAKILGQAGFSVSQIQDSLKGVTLLATATGSDLETAVDVASSVISVFNLRAEDMGHVANVVTGAINETKLTMDKLALGVQYAGNIAAEAGLEFDEFTAILGSMANAGIRSGSTLGTGLRQVLIELLSPSDKFVKKLREVGLTVEDIDVKAKGFVGVMETLKQAGFSTADAFDSFEVRSAAAFAAIQNDPGLINDLRESFLLTNAAMKANETQMRSLAATSDQFKSILGTVIVSMTGPLKGALTVSLKLFGDLLSVLNEYPIVLGTIGTLLAGLAVTFAGGGLVALIKGLVTGLPVILSVGRALAGTAGLAALATGVAVPFLATVAAVSAVIAGLWSLHKVLSPVNEDLDKLQANLNTSEGAYDKNKESIDSLDSSLSKLVTRYEQLKQNPRDVVTEMISLQTQFGDLGLNIKNSVNPSVDDLIAALKELKYELAETSVDKITDVLNNRAKIFTTLSEEARKQAGKSFLERDSRFSSADQRVQTSNAIIAGNASLIENIAPNIEGASAKDRDKYKQALISYRGTLQQEIKGQSKYLEELTAVNASSPEQAVQLARTTKAVKEASADLRAQLSVTERFLAQLSGYSIDARKKIEGELSASPFQKYFDGLIENMNKEVATLSSELANVPNDNATERTRIQKEILKVKTMYYDKLIKFLEENGKLLDEYLGVSPEETAGYLAKLKGEVEQSTHDIESKVVAAADNTVSKYEEMMTRASASFTMLSNTYSHVSDKFDQDIKRLDFISKEVTDIERGGLRGRYSDAELSMFEDRKKNQQAQALKSKIDFLPQMIASLNAKAGAQSAKVGEFRIKEQAKTTPDSTIARIQQEVELNSILNERRNLENELINLQNEYNAMMGIATEANKSLWEQVTYVVGSYQQQMAIQSEWSYGLKENVIKVLDNGRAAFKSFVTDTVTGTKSIGDAFKDMARSIIESMLDITTDKLAAQMFGMVSGSFGGVGLVGGTAGQSSRGFFDILGSALGGSYGPGFNGGGIVKANSGAYIGRDNQLVMAQEGEGILRRGAMELLGRDNFSQLNAMGNRQISAASANMTGYNQPAAGGPVVTNVYVVSPDQKPSLTKNDVVVIITEDLAKGGSTKKLVKSIVSGQT